MNLKTTAMAAAMTLGVVGATAYAHGFGTDMSGGYHMEQGMMGGYGGYGMGQGMMGGLGLGAIERLDLSAEQRSQIDSIERELRRTNWALMEKMHDAMETLHEPTSMAGKSDRAAVLAASKRVSDLRQQMLENSLDARDKAEALLTPQQREQARQSTRERRESHCS